MNKKRILTWLAIVVLALALVAATASTVVSLKANQTVTVVCQGDEIIVTPHSDTEMDITCRVWLGEGQR